MRVDVICYDCCMKRTPFSDVLETWMRGKQPKTLASLIKMAEDKSFAVIILFLMLLPALPIPTGGLTHIFEIITMLLACEMMLGFSALWLPRRWQKLSVKSLAQGKALTLMLRRIRWLERYSTPRGRTVFALPLADRLIGLVIFALALTAFLAPPFSGLDTLPALGVVILCLALILEDALFLLLGVVVGGIGLALVLSLGTAVFTGLKHII